MLIKDRKGFTLVELLAVVLIISIVLGISGYVVTQVISNSKTESIALTISNVKNGARMYVEEYRDEVLWQQNDEKVNQKYSCVSINELINKNFLNKSIEDNYDLVDYVIVSKDDDGNIVSEELDNNNICSNENIMVKVPTSSEYCIEGLKYNTLEQELTKEAENFTFINNKATNAGTYNVKAKLNVGYTWMDGTVDDKTINCSIAKVIPDIKLNPMGIDNSNVVIGETASINVAATLTTPMGEVEVPGKIVAKSSNKDYIDIKSISTNSKEVIIEFLSSRVIESYVTVTIIPDDTNNYYNSSATFTVGIPSKKTVEIPTTLKYCKNLVYNQNTQTLVEQPEEGILFYNTEAIDIGEYEITARLKYGYSWVDSNGNVVDDLDDKTFKCSIATPTPTVTYDNQSGSGCSSKVVTYGESYGDLCTPTRAGYTFLGWYTSSSSGTQVTNDTEVTDFNNHTLYARWRINKVYIQLNTNGGTVKSSTTENGVAYTWATDANGIITRTTASTGDKLTNLRIINYGATSETSGLPNWDNSSYLYITKSGYKGKSGAEWKCLSGCSTAGKTFSDDAVVSAADFCDASSGDCTVVLGVNWIESVAPTCKVTKTNTYSIYGVDLTVTCSDSGSGCTKASTSYADVKSNKTYEVYDNAGNKGTCSVSIYSTTRYRKRTRSYNSCATSTTKWGGTCIVLSPPSLKGTHTISGAASKEQCEAWCDNKAGVTGTYSIACESSTTCTGAYTSWSSWSNYSYNSCSESSTVDCGSATVYY